MCVTWLVCVCGSRVVLPLLWESWLVYMCDMPQVYVWCDAFIGVLRSLSLSLSLSLLMGGPWFVYMGDMTQAYEWYEWYNSYEWVISLIYLQLIRMSSTMRDVTHIHDLYNSYTWVISLIYLYHMSDSMSYIMSDITHILIRMSEIMSDVI